MPTPRAEFTRAGALAALVVDGLSLLQYPASELEAGPCQLWVRRRDGDGGLLPHPVTGPASGSLVAGDAVTGRLGGLAYTAWFDIVESGYVWQWEVVTGARRPKRWMSCSPRTSP